MKQNQNGTVRRVHQGMRAAARSGGMLLRAVEPAAAHLAGAGALFRHPGVVVHAEAAHHHGDEAKGQHDGVDDQRQPAGVEVLQH